MTMFFVQSTKKITQDQPTGTKLYHIHYLTKADKLFPMFGQLSLALLPGKK